jgi:hypothetical protein
VAPSGETVAGFEEMMEGLGLKVTFRLGFLCSSVGVAGEMRGVVSLGRLVDDMASDCADAQSTKHELYQTRCLVFPHPQITTLEMAKCSFAARI